MAYFIGTDLVEIKRIETSMETPAFLKKVCGSRELRELEERGFPAQSAAAAFAAKEAFGKALGTGLRGFALREVELLHRESGKPYLALSGAAAQRAKGYEFDISISHTDTLAIATVIGWEAEGVVSEYESLYGAGNPPGGTDRV